MVVNTIKDLLEYLKINTDDISLLPICHTRKLDDLRKYIARQKKLVAYTEDENGNKHLFFFYGKSKFVPASEVKNEFGKSAPFTLIYDLQEVMKQSLQMNFVCFDSGGFERYKITTAELRDFLIEDCNEETIKKFVKCFYKSNENYLGKNFTPEVNHEDYPICGAIWELHRMAQEVKDPNQTTEYGEQAFTCEIRFKDMELELNPITVVAPDSQLTSDHAIAQWEFLFNNAQIIPYNSKDTNIHAYYKMSEEVEKQITEVLQ